MIYFKIKIIYFQEHDVSLSSMYEIYSTITINVFYKSLAGWTFAFYNYYIENTTRYLDNPYFQTMADIVDPYCKCLSCQFEILFS
jgi:PhoPQ-activated pathogenicity-related protein